MYGYGSVTNMRICEYAVGGGSILVPGIDEFLKYFDKQSH